MSRKSRRTGTASQTRQERARLACLAEARRGGAPVPKANEGGRLWQRPLIAPLAVILLVLLATIDDRHVGRAADERQIIWTAVALSETGQLGQARGRDFTYLTSDGRAVSRFGIGMSLLEVPAAVLAPGVEAKLGAGSSQPLFLLVPLMLVLAAAAAAGAAARLLGAGARGMRAAVLLAGIGSPLGSYAATGFSESLQAAALAASYALALGASAASNARGARTRALLAGFAASWAILAKSSLVLAVPAVLLPLLLVSPVVSRGARLRSAVLGLLPGGVLWAVLELDRFGRLFGSYPGEAFNHPFWDGAWRLLVGPNLGLVLFFPALLCACWAVGRAIAHRDVGNTLRFGAGVLPLVVLLALAAGWWAWHGVWGWGPRLLVPAVPMLAAVAGTVVGRWRRWITIALVATSVAINLPGLLQHPVPVAGYISNLRWPAAPAGVARSFAGYAWRLDADGSYHVSPDQLLSSVPQASQFIVFPWFFHATSQSDVALVARALALPPWRGVRPDLVPAQDPMSEDFLRQITGQPRSRFWGRGFWPSPKDADYAAVYDEGLADQVIRVEQQRDGLTARRLALKLVGLAPSGANDALVLESYRIVGDRPAAAEYLSGLSRERRAAPAINVVLALFERDAGHEEAAHQLLASAAGALPSNAPIQRALTAPTSQWPDDLQSMMAGPVKAAGQ